MDIKHTPEEEPVTSTGWAESVARSAAQMSAGQTMRLEPALQRLRASIARLTAKRVEQLPD